MGLYTIHDLKRANYNINVGNPSQVYEACPTNW